jgi:hypothetical protein
MRFQGNLLRIPWVLRSSTVRLKGSILKTTRSRAVNRIDVRVPRSLTNRMVLPRARLYRPCPSSSNVPLNRLIASCASTRPARHETMPRPFERTDETPGAVDSIKARQRVGAWHSPLGQAGQYAVHLRDLTGPHGTMPPGRCPTRDSSRLEQSDSGVDLPETKRLPFATVSWPGICYSRMHENSL